MDKLKPLAERLRPKKIDDIIGQEHLLGKDAPLRKIIESGQLCSMILWGPPGSGKTSLAYTIAEITGKSFYKLSAINSGVKEVKSIIDEAIFRNESLIVFIDEIHRFSKSQQDSLLWAIETGTIIFIGATTENPSFEVIPPLLSRCQIFVLNELTENDLQILIERAVIEENKVKSKNIIVKEKEALFRASGGDARKLLNIIEFIINSYNTKDVIITNEVVEKVLQKSYVIYDKDGENHYNIISAFIKSIRGSDPNGAVYWLARMVEGGEDPEFIARRLVILASEDIGNANPNALLLANSCYEAVRKVGYPECRIILSQTAIYLACSPKSNSAYIAIEKALECVRHKGNLPVPLHLRNAPTFLMKKLGYGKNYKYAHDFENNFVNIEFLPEEISGSKFYEPGNNPRESEMKNFLKSRWGKKYNY